MGRPRGRTTSNLVTTIPTPLFKRLGEIRTRLGVPVSVLVTKALKAYFNSGNAPVEFKPAVTF
jgi:hypothetical protein